MKYSILVFVASLLMAANSGMPQQDAAGKTLKELQEAQAQV